MNIAILHSTLIRQFLYLLVILLSCFLPVQGQEKIEISNQFNLIRNIVTTETIGNNLIYRLDTLKSKYIPSRSSLTDYFNRDIDFGFKHRRMLMQLDFEEYQINVLCRNDTIFVVSVISPDNMNILYGNYNKEVIDVFLKQRNTFYGSSKTAAQLTEDISLPEQYAFYCGDAAPKTQQGAYIEQLVEVKNIIALAAMLKSFNCETQAYGVAGFDMLRKKGYKASDDIKGIIKHIKKRNSELIVCSGCLAGLIQKVYSKK